VAKDGSLKVLEQHMSLVDDSTQSAVEAHYDARKNVTSIVIIQPEGQSDDNKNQKNHDDGEYQGAVKLPGVVLLRLTSSQGHLIIEVPGL
jgi:putative IMPACT (imprinted ancient) family translation regulator